MDYIQELEEKLSEKDKLIGEFREVVKMALGCWPNPMIEQRRKMRIVLSKAEKANN